MTSPVEGMSLFLWRRPDPDVQKFAMYAPELTSAQLMFVQNVKKLLDEADRQSPGTVQTFEELRKDIASYEVQRHPRGGPLDELLADQGFTDCVPYTLIVFTDPVPAIQ